MRHHKAETEAAQSDSARLETFLARQEALRDQQESLLDKQATWLNALPAEFAKAAHEFLAERLKHLNDLLRLLPDLFDAVHDEWSLWEANTALNEAEKPARPDVLPVLEKIKARIEDWQKRRDVELEDPLANEPAAKVKYDEWRHERVDSEDTEDPAEHQTIKEVTRVGYRWRGEWLRKPEVIVRTVRKTPRAAGAAPPAAPPLLSPPPTETPDEAAPEETTDIHE